MLSKKFCLMLVFWLVGSFCFAGDIKNTLILVDVEWIGANQQYEGTYQTG
jgi:hypothetical protein